MVCQPPEKCTKCRLIKSGTSGSAQIGADVRCYITLKRYGSKYEVISSVTIVSADAKLVDVQTGL